MVRPDRRSGESCSEKESALHVSIGTLGPAVVNRAGFSPGDLLATEHNSAIPTASALNFRLVHPQDTTCTLFLALDAGDWTKLDTDDDRGTTPPS